MIQLTNISKYYKSQGMAALHHVSLNIPEGKILVLLGSSGSGKTTLLKMMNRLVTPTEGSITIDRKDIQGFPVIQLRRAIGYVPQNSGLFPHMTIEQNISILLKVMHHSASSRRKRVTELLNMLHLSPPQFLHRYPDELSGGQQQRVAVARALAANPKYILMDEPFSGLDTIARAALQTEIVALNKTVNKTMVFVTHDIAEAEHIADYIAVMHHGQLEQMDEKSTLLKNPKTDFVKRLIQISRPPMPLIRS